MAASTIFKPETRKGPVFLSPTDQGAPVITLPDGREITGVPANRKGGAFFNEGRYQWVFPTEILGIEGAKLSFGGKTVDLESTNQSYEGNGIDSWKPRGKGSVGSGSATGVPNGLTPGSDPTGNGFFPADLTSEFPKPTLTNFDPITGAPYNFTDVKKFAQDYGEFNRGELDKYNTQAKGFALDALDTELQGLQGYVPGAAALKRRETSLDNQFNQQQRLQQVRGTLPFAEGDLEAQRQRANIYARGGIPNEVTDRGLEIGIRSGQADFAASAGFGGTSVASRNAQDLMTAQQRLQIAQQGEQNIASNLQTSSNLLLAPTEYSNAGQQVNVMPSLSGSQLQTNARGEIAQFAGVPTTTALSNTIQQEQYRTNLVQRTQEYNASNNFQESTQNAGIQNDFALKKFDYRANLAGAIAGGFQTGRNTEIEMQQQQAALDLYRETLKAAQSLKTLNGIFSGLGSLFGAGSGILDFITKLSDFLGGGNDNNPAVHTPAANPPSQPTAGQPSSSPNSGDSGKAPTSEKPSESTPSDPSFNDQGPPDRPLDQSEIPAGQGTPDDYEPFLARRRAIQAQEQAKDDIANSKTPEEAFEKAARYAQLSPAMRSSGLSNTPKKGYVQSHIGPNGKPIYSDAQLANSQDPNAGKDTVDGLLHILNPFGVFSPEDTSTLTRISDASKDANLLLGLANAYATGDKKGFANALINRFQKAGVAAIAGQGDDKAQDRAKLNSLIDSAQLFSNWGNLSGAQKAKAIASIGINGYYAYSGKDLGLTDIIKPTLGPDNKPIKGTGLNVSQALDLFGQGYNVYNLVKNWDQYSDIQKITYGASTAAGIASTMEEYGLLNLGTTSATAGAGAAAGAGTAAGAGAASTGAAAGTGVAAELPAVTSGGSAVTGAGSQTSTLGMAGTALGYVAGAGAVYIGGETVRKNWGRGGAEGRAIGAAGGVTLASGISALGGTNPYLFAAVVAVSVIGGTVKTGKHSDQIARDSVRAHFRDQVGSLSKDWKVSLADGSQVDVGIDGRGGQKGFADPSKLVGKQKGYSKRAVYDIDYTNDLDYASGMAGVALSRLVTGGTNKGIDQFGGQLGNAALQGLDGKGMTQANFNKVMENHRAIYSQNGIKSKSDAYKLSIDMLNDGRVNASEAVAMQQAFNMMYDRDGYSGAQRLMGGRFRGAEVAADKPDSVDPGFNRPAPGQDTSGTRRPTFNRPEGQRPTEGNNNFNRPPPSRTPNRADSGFNRLPPNGSPNNQVARLPSGHKWTGKLRSASEAKAANRARYA